MAEAIESTEERLAVVVAQQRTWQSSEVWSSLDGLKNLGELGRPVSAGHLQSHLHLQERQTDRGAMARSC